MQRKMVSKSADIYSFGEFLAQGINDREQDSTPKIH